MSERLTDRRLIWRALVDAHAWADSLIDSYHRDDAAPQVIEQKRLMAGYERLAKKHYGQGIAETLNAPFKGAKLVPISSTLAPKTPDLHQPPTDIPPRNS